MYGKGSHVVIFKHPLLDFRHISFLIVEGKNGSVPRYEQRLKGNRGKGLGHIQWRFGGLYKKRQR